MSKIAVRCHINRGHLHFHCDLEAAKSSSTSRFTVAEALPDAFSFSATYNGTLRFNDTRPSGEEGRPRLFLVFFIHCPIGLPWQRQFLQGCATVLSNDLATGQRDGPGVRVPKLSALASA